MPVGAREVRSVVDFLRVIKEPALGISALKWYAETRPRVVEQLARIEHDIKAGSSVDSLLDELPGEFAHLSAAVKSLIARGQREAALGRLLRQRRQLRSDL